MTDRERDADDFQCNGLLKSLLAMATANLTIARAVILRLPLARLSKEQAQAHCQVFILGVLERTLKKCQEVFKPGPAQLRLRSYLRAIPACCFSQQPARSDCLAVLPSTAPGWLPSNHPQPCQCPGVLWLIVSAPLGPPSVFDRSSPGQRRRVSIPMTFVNRPPCFQRRDVLLVHQSVCKHGTQELVWLLEVSQ